MSSGGTTQKGMVLSDIVTNSLMRAPAAAQTAESQESRLAESVSKTYKRVMNAFPPDRSKSASPGTSAASLVKPGEFSTFEDPGEAFRKGFVSHLVKAEWKPHFCFGKSIVAVGSSSHWGPKAYLTSPPARTNARAQPDTKQHESVGSLRSFSFPDIGCWVRLHFSLGRIHRGVACDFIYAEPLHIRPASFSPNNRIAGSGSY